MLANQKERLPQFKNAIETIIDVEGITKVEELLGAKGRTIRLWLKGEQHPVSASFESYEKIISEYVAKLKLVPLEKAPSEDALEPAEREEGGVPAVEQEVVLMGAEEPSEAVSEGITFDLDLVDQGVGILIPLDLVDANPYQPRKDFDEEAMEELKNSIAESGLLQHPVVRLVGNRYQLIAGERRTRACRLLGKTEIMFNVVKMSDSEVATAALVENLQRQDVSQIATARAIKRMMDEFGTKQSEMAVKLGVTQAKVSQMMALLRLSEPILEMVESGKISSSIGRTLASLPLDIQEDVDLDELPELNVKDCQETVNNVKTILEHMPTGEIEGTDSLMTKFIKHMHAGGYIHVLDIAEYQHFYIQEFKEHKSFRMEIGRLGSGAWDMKPFQFLRDALNKDSQYRSLQLYFKENEGLWDAIFEFMDTYCPYEEPESKPTSNASNAFGSSKEMDSEIESKPAAPRMSKEEKEEAIKEAQENSPVPILSISKGTTKTERLLKRIQEHQGEPIHEQSHRCYNCIHFNADATDYQGRCGAEYGFSVNQLDRYKVSGQPDLISCSKYTPTEEQLKKEMKPGIEFELGLLKMALRSASHCLHSLTKLVPSLKGKKKEEIEQAYVQMQDHEKAYFISALSRILGMSMSGSEDRFLLLPTGEFIPVKTAMIVGADDI